MEQEIPTSPPNEGNSTTVMVLGIVASGLIVISCGYLSFISLILGIIGLVMRNNDVKQHPELANNSRMKAGFIMSIISIIIGALVTVSLIIALVFIGFAMPWDMLSDPNTWKNYAN